MSDGSKVSSLRERLTSGTEDKLGKALTDLFDNPLVSGTIGRAFDARERAVQAQELALSALNIPTAADIERLTRRLRSVSQRLEGIEDGVHRLNRAFSDGGVERRLAAMEEQLRDLGNRLSGQAPAPASGSTKAAGKAPKAASAAPRAVGAAPKTAPSATGRTSKAPARTARTPAKRPAGARAKKSA